MLVIGKAGPMLNSIKEGSQDANPKATRVQEDDDAAHRDIHAGNLIHLEDRLVEVGM